MQPIRFACFVLAAAVLLLACGPATEADTGVSSSAAQLASANSLDENGLAVNGIFQNGIFQNGIFQNGIFQNGLVQNGLWQDAIWQANPAALQLLRSHPHTPQLLQYMYECAMSTEQSSVLDPDGPRPLVLQGRIGLAPHWGQAGGTCDESCQRWVSACLLARTNAYGVKVNISLRAPDTAPEAIRNALAVTPEERAQYRLLEGAFFGNIFRQTQLPDGELVMAPIFHGCVASRISETPRKISAKFCSRVGGAIHLEGNCDAAAAADSAAGVCATLGPAPGGLGDCRAAGTHYSEVISVYLGSSIAVCDPHVVYDSPGKHGESLNRPYLDALDSDTLWSARHDPSLSNSPHLPPPS